jgi:p-hydroxybenzoate 3-monooxygenase
MESLTARCPVPVAPSCRTLRPTHPKQGEDYVRTQVGIVGAGPAGLLLAHLLHLRGIESVILESRSREYVEQRIRAGVLEQGTVDLLARSGLDERLRREGLVHHGIELQFDGKRHRIALSDLAGGRAITVYGQQEVVKDLIEARIETGGPLLFEAEALRLEGLDSRPAIRYRHEDREHELSCDVIAGCDGFHGICRSSIPPAALTVYERQYPFAWLGILAEVAPSSEELVYAYHDNGFALHSLRSPELSRFYLQCDPGDDPDGFANAEIWSELRIRLGASDSWALAEGPIIEKGVTPMRAFVAEPMRYGRLFLAGDAAHIVPPTGAKGLNLAVADVRVLAAALEAWYESGDEHLLDTYSATCLRRVWRVQHFSSWMTSLLHRFPAGDGFQIRLQRAQLEELCSSTAAATTLAENYVGLNLGD